MPFPDDKALRGFRSKAQSRWAHATDQWWADEYAKNTNYDSIPDRVDEDVTEGIDGWADPYHEDHPVVGIFEKAFEALKNAKTVKDFEKASVDIFNVARFWDQDENLQNKKMAELMVGPYTTILSLLEKWKEAANDKIDPDIKERWEEFVERHGDPETDVWEPMAKASQRQTDASNEQAYSMGEKAGAEVSEEVADWINFELGTNKHIHTAFIKGLVRGSLNNIQSDDTAAIPVNENALIRKAARQTGFDKEVMEKFWEDSVKEETAHHNEDRKGRVFWSKVVEKFKSKIRHIDVLEAKRIMTDRKELRKSIDKFVNTIAQGDYVSAQSVVPEMIKKQLGTMINRKKEAYLKELGKQVKERAKEA